MSTSTSPRKVAAALTELWSPRVIAEVDDSYVKVAKVKGVFGWHAHTDEDELFLILAGHLRIELEDGAVELDEGGPTGSGKAHPRRCARASRRRPELSRP